MAKKKNYMVPVFIHVKAQSYEGAELLVIQRVDRTMLADDAPKAIKNWSLIPFNVRKEQHGSI